MIKSKFLRTLNKVFFLSMFVLITHCPVAKKIYLLDSGSSDIVERKDAQKNIQDALLIYLSRCNDSLFQAGILTYWDPILKAKPCSAGILSYSDTSIKYCYEKLFLDKSNVDTCRLLLIASSCGIGVRETEIAITHTICKKSLVLEKYSSLIKVL